MKKPAHNCSRTGTRKTKTGRTFIRSINEEENHPDNMSYRILVVDDEPDILKLNTEVLTDSGYDVEVAEDGSKAWEAIQNSSYDLIITDNEMPNMSGVKLLEKLHDANKNIPAIMATGTMPSNELIRQPWFQVVPIVLKPYTLKELLETVKNVLRSVSNASAT